MHSNKRRSIQTGNATAADCNSDEKWRIQCILNLIPNWFCRITINLTLVNAEIDVSFGGKYFKCNKTMNIFTTNFAPFLPKINSPKLPFQHLFSFKNKAISFIDTSMTYLNFKAIYVASTCMWMLCIWNWK